MLRKAEGRWERWQVQGWKRKWTLGNNEFIQGGGGNPWEIGHALWAGFCKY